MSIDQPSKADAAMPLAAMAFDFEQVELALKLAERDWTASVHVATAP